MIDTDKYKGLTEGNWMLERSEVNPNEFLLKCGDKTITWLEASDEDAQLIAAAPFLLDEVKRLTNQAKDNWELDIKRRKEIKNWLEWEKKVYRFFGKEAMTMFSEWMEATKDVEE